MKGAIATAILVALARGSLAHEHHTDSIPEGEAVSPDPIVRLYYSTAAARELEADSLL